MLRWLAVWPSFGFGLYLLSDSRLQMTNFTPRFRVNATRGSLATHSSVVKAELPRRPQLSRIINLHQIPNTERWKALFNKAGKHFQQQRKTKCSLRRWSDSFPNPIRQCLQTKVEKSAPAALPVAKAGTAFSALERNAFLGFPFVFYSGGTDPSASRTPAKHSVIPQPQMQTCLMSLSPRKSDPSTSQ